MSLNSAPDFAVNLAADTFADTFADPASNLYQSSSEQSKLKPRSNRLSLAQVEMGKSYIVDQVAVPDSQSDWAQQLEDIGFIPGEPVAIMARGMLGGDPLVVRIGLSTFALRRAEAQCISVLELDPSKPTHLSNSSHSSNASKSSLHTHKATR